jgi:predicted protein tyrosine phosphatase
MKNILFICSANKDRSKTAEDYFSEQYPKFSFDSAGTNKKICNQLGTNYIEEHQLNWADKIYVMESKHSRTINDRYGSKFNNKIIILNIKDVYQYGSSELIEVLKNKQLLNF